MITETSKIKAELLYKLYRRGIWGGRHTPIRNLYYLASKKAVNELREYVKELANEGFILLKKSTGEIHISLNPHKKAEIRNLIIKVLEIDPEMLK